ncbi:MAG: DUF4153 domain-containing protein [Desulfosporosinus sp.]|jgi:hypothetical protein
MNFFRSISQILKGAAKAFQTFPAAIFCALVFAIVTMIRIYLAWPQQEPYNFLFNCLHWSFALGAIFSLTVITFAQSYYNRHSAFLTANLLGVMAAVLTFLMLYLLSGIDPGLAGSRYALLSGLAVSRVSVAILVSFLAFIILAGYPKDQSDFARSFFMTIKAFFIALLYGLVIMAGTSGVAGAIEALLYEGMSEKVYMYLATLAGFLAFTIFVGYFPDFRKGQVDQQREVAQKQPRFVEVLFEYIMIPIVLALTVVLLLWAAKTIMSGMGAPFVQLSSIAAAYTLGGIWLYVMVTHYESGLAKFYRRIYPIAALVILAFEAWALLIELQKESLKVVSYSFSIIWIIALVSAILLLIHKDKAYQKIVLLICAMAIIAVLPVIGYHALPVSAQVSRLESLLVSQGMLKGDQITPALAEPEMAVRQSITDAVSYLADAENAKLPAWFDKNLAESGTFKTRLGFEKTWPKSEEIYPDSPMGTHLTLPAEAIDISDYHWAIGMQPLAGKVREGTSLVTVKGNKGLYQINWTLDMQMGIPTLAIELDNREILKQDMKVFTDQIAKTFPPGQTGQPQPNLKDMSLRLDTPEVTVLLVFSNVDISVYPYEDIIHYYLNLNTLYMKEKP